MILNTNYARPIVCLCCEDPLAIINGMPLNVLIYLCTFHSQGVNLINVREDVEFNADRDWKFRILLDKIQQIGINGNQQEIHALVYKC